MFLQGIVAVTRLDSEFGPAIARASACESRLDSGWAQRGRAFTRQRRGDAFSRVASFMLLQADTAQ